MKKIIGILIIVFAVLMMLPLLGISALGNLAEGILAWAVAIIILVIGVLFIMMKD